VLDVESQIAGAVMRAREQSSDANDICEELCRKDPGPAFVRQKVVQASLHASVADLRATSAERFQRRMELEMQQSALQ
ncbi:NUDT8, partial [Symbiodinium necroappetens]